MGLFKDSIFDRVIVRRYRLTVPETCGRLEGTIRIAMIGDLHNRKFGDGNDVLVNQIEDLNPDLIFTVGDLIVTRPGRKTDIGVGMRVMKRLSYICPMYCVYGNHEQRAKVYPDVYPGVNEDLKRAYHIANVSLLSDEKEQFELKGIRFSVFGLEIPLKHYRRFDRSNMNSVEIEEKINRPDEKRFNVLLAHTPTFFESYSRWGANLTCSGHFHGGVIRIPFLGGVISPQMRLFPKYDCGLFEKYGKYLLVTAGLGSHSFAPRIGNPPEVVLLELYQSS